MWLYRLLIVTILVLSFGGCKEKHNPNEPAKMHWDRDMCQRCKMVVSERKYAAQVINPKTQKVYKFDDIGCAILWLEEEHIPWRDVKIWITDAKSGKWIDAKKALYTDDSITPMAYGVAAFTKETFPKDHKALRFEEIIPIIKKIEEHNNQQRGVVSQ